MDESWDQTTHFNLQEPLQTARDVIEGEFDSFRADLGSWLRDFEHDLACSLDELPSWIDLDIEALHQMFLCPALSAFQGALIGPRAAATVAGRVEAEIWKCFSPDSHLVDPQPWITIASRLETLDDSLATAQVDIGHYTRRLAGLLAGQLEDLQEQLDALRHSDLEALRSDRRSRDVHDGRRDAAAGWEEQRQRVRELQDGWQPIELLAFEGGDLTCAGLLRLRTIIRRAARELRSLYPDMVIDLASLPGEEYPTVLTSLRTTEPIQLERGPAPSDAQVPPADLPGPTRPMTDRPGPTQPPARPMLDRAPRGAQSSAVSAKKKVTPPRLRKLPSPAAPSTQPEEEFSLDASVSLVTPGLQKVGFGELFVATGVPLSGLAGLVGLHAGLLFGWLPVSVYPSYSAAALGSFGLLSAWLLLAPVLLGWRIARRNGRFGLVLEIEEELIGQIHMDARTIVWPGQAHSTASLAGTVYRWESKEDDDFGWLLELRQGTQTVGAFRTLERNYTTWEQSALAIEERRDDAWQIAPKAFYDLRDNLKIR